jgi:hypothetical protein
VPIDRLDVAAFTFVWDSTTLRQQARLQIPQRVVGLDLPHDHLGGGIAEPVSSDDLDGLRLLRDHAPAGMEVTAGEYGYPLFYLERLLFDGAHEPVDGALAPDLSRPGLGLELERADAARYAL